MENKDAQIISFSSAKEWREWLAKNQEETIGVWLQIFKKGSNTPTVTYAEALDEALCYGWIDGQKKKYDEISWLQKFTPRRARSIWSKRNIAHIERLTKEKRMQPGGIKQVELAKADGRWENAYDPPSSMQMPNDFLENLKKNDKAYAFYKTLNKANLYAIAWRLQTAKKPETRSRNMDKIIAMLQKGEKTH